MAMSVELGFSTKVFDGVDGPFLQKMEMIKKAAPDAAAIELSFSSLAEFGQPISRSAMEIARSFPCRSIAAPIDIRFNSTYVQVALELLSLSLDISAQAIVVQPDTLEDQALLQNLLGDLVALKNHRRGDPLSELDKLFEIIPSAGLVINLPNLFLQDPTMNLAGQIHRQFGDRLWHYQIGGIGPHGGRRYLHQDPNPLVFKGVLDKTKPVIIEGGSGLPTKSLLRHEFDYIQEQLDL